MVELLSIGAGVAGIISAVTITYYLIQKLIPIFENILHDYTGDQRVASLLSRFAVYYVALRAVTRIASLIGDMDVYLVSDIAEIFRTASGTALGIFGELRWFIYIGALLLIGFNISKLR